MGLLDQVAGALAGPPGPEGGRFGYYPDPPRASSAGAGSGPATINALPRVNPVTAVRLTSDTSKLVADCGAPAAGLMWSIRRMSVQGPALTRALVYVGDYNSPSSWVNGTNSGDLDETECVQPIIVPTGQKLYLVWTLKAGGAFPAGTVATVRVEYDEQAVS